MTNKNSLHHKLNIFILIVMSLIIIIGCTVAIYLFNQVTRKYYIDDIKKVSDDFQRLAISSNKERLNSYLELISDDKFVEQLLNQSISSPEKNGDVDFIDIKSSNLERTILGKLPENVKDLMYQNAPKPGSATTTWIDGNKNTGLYVFSMKSLVASNGTNPITITAGSRITSDKYTNYIKDVFKMDATIFAEDVRINTSIVKNGVVQTGTPLNSKIAEIVLKKGEVYIGETNILNMPYYTIYTPILGPNNTIIGALFVGNSLNDLSKKNYDIIISISILGIILLVGTKILSYRWVNNKFINPLIELSSTIKTISEGNYNIKIPYNNKDYEEIHNLYVVLNKMVEEILNNREKIELIAYYDTLTGIKNRAFMFQQYDVNDNNAINKERLKLLFYLNIDKLKIVNDLRGHKVGDILIIEVSKMLTKLVNSYNCYNLFRLSGDEFVICRKTNFKMHELHDFAKEILDSFKEPFCIGDYQFNITVSIGIAYCKNCNGIFCEECTENCEKPLYQLLKDAEIALYQVKAEGKNNYKVFDAKMYELLKTKTEIENDLKFALENNEFLLYYQPQYDILTNDFRGFEALIRWQKPGKGLIPPDSFIYIAEETGLILPIGNLVLRTACEFVKSINTKYNKQYIVSVNVSAAQILSNDYEESVLSTLKEIGVDTKFLELEITESVLIDSLSLVNDKLINLHKKGISIALDDFGTGYSSLTYLRELPIVILKVDKAFVDDIFTNDKSIVGDIIKIGHHMNLKVIAEGVEIKEQLDFLEQLKCDIIQGYYFSKPLPEKELLEKLKLK